MGFLFFLSIPALIILILDIIGIIMAIAAGTKIKAKCTGFISPYTDEYEAGEPYGSVFEYEDEGETKKAYTMDNFQYVKDKIYKILIFNTSERCEVMRTLNKSYFFDILLFTVAAYIFMSKIYA